MRLEVEAHVPLLADVLHHAAERLLVEGLTPGAYVVDGGFAKLGASVAVQCPIFEVTAYLNTFLTSIGDEWTRTKRRT